MSIKIIILWAEVWEIKIYFPKISLILTLPSWNLRWNLPKEYSGTQLRKNLWAQICQRGKTYTITIWFESLTNFVLLTIEKNSQPQRIYESANLPEKFHGNRMKASSSMQRINLPQINWKKPNLDPQSMKKFSSYLTKQNCKLLMKNSSLFSNEKTWKYKQDVFNWKW